MNIKQEDEEQRGKSRPGTRNGERSEVVRGCLVEAVTEDMSHLHLTRLD